MTLLFCDGFDHYTTVLDKWTTNDSGTITAAEGRNGTAGMKYGGYQSYTRKTLSSSNQVLTAGVALYVPSLTQVAGVIVLAFLDNGSYQCDVRVNADATLKITRNNTTLATSTKSIAAAAWYYIELQVYSLYL